MKSESVNVRPAHSPGEALRDPYDRQDLARLLAFDRGIILPGDRWFYKDTLGEGAFGHAAIWVKYNAQGRMIDRIAIKECYLTPVNWAAGTLWYDGQPGESVVNQALNQCQDSYNVIYRHTSRLFEELCMYRVYLEHCELGTLENVIQQHGESRNERRLDDAGRDLQHNIPIRALWAIFETLPSALYLMKHGYLPGADPPATWDAIIHRDLKPDNFLLSAPHDRFWRGFPTVKVADFGLAGYKSHPNVTAPGVGFPCYMAPETYERQIDSSSDIWSIGRTMLSLMQLEQSESVQQYDLAENQGTPIMDEAEARYNGPLLSLVRYCLMIDPRKRPNATRLYNAIVAEVAAHVGMRDDL